MPMRKALRTVALEVAIVTPESGLMTGVTGTALKIPGYRNGNGLISLSVIALALLSVTSCVSTNSFGDDSHYVPRGPRTGYYIVRPGSALMHQLGIEGAPASDTADPLRRGYGADALAFRFNRAGVLSAPPAYIVQATPNDFYTRRLGSLIRGRSTTRDVETFFGRPQSIERRPDGSIAYYAIVVYNPFEDRSGGGRR